MYTSNNGEIFRWLFEFTTIKYERIRKIDFNFKEYIESHPRNNVYMYLYHDEDDYSIIIITQDGTVYVNYEGDEYYRSNYNAVNFSNYYYSYGPVPNNGYELLIETPLKFVGVTLVTFVISLIVVFKVTPAVKRKVIKIIDNI